MDVKLPKLGESAEGGSVVSILVKEGDTVAKCQTILELENEKAVAPIPAPASGVVTQIRVKEGERVAVGQVILTLADSGPAPAAARSIAPTGKAAATQPAAGPPAAGPQPAASPASPPAASPGPGQSPGLGIELPADGPVP